MRKRTIAALFQGAGLFIASLGIALFSGALLGTAVLIGSVSRNVAPITNSQAASGAEAMLALVGAGAIALAFGVLLLKAGETLLVAPEMSPAKVC